MNQRLSELDVAAVGDPQQAVKPKGLKKLIAVLHEELQGIHPRYQITQILVSCLPQNSFCRVRTLLYRAAGFRIGKGTVLFGKLTLNGNGCISRMLSIGADTRINSPLYAELNAPITIGNHVAIGHHVVFITTDHDTSNPVDRSGNSKFNPIIVEDGAWIGACVTILPGVTIGRASVVSAGSVVSQSVPANKLVGGVPARPVKTLEG